MQTSAYSADASRQRAGGRRCEHSRILADVGFGDVVRGFAEVGYAFCPLHGDWSPLAVGKSSGVSRLFRRARCCGYSPIFERDILTSNLF